jgi:N4-gp56 family major capsid protein
MAFTWTYDAPSGSYKQHALSRKMYEASVEDSHFVEFARPVDGFGKKKGENVTLIRLATIAEPSDGTITESTRIPEDNFALSAVSITVTEMGRSVPFTSLAEDLSTFDLENPIQMRLKEQQKLTLDTSCAAAFKTAKVCYIPTGSASYVIDPDGIPSTTATSNLNVFHVETIADEMWDTYRVPRLSGDDYVAICRTLALRGIKRDPQWESWKVYTTPEAKATGEVGRIEGCRFVQTNHANALGKVGAGSVLGECVFFGQDSVALAEVQTPELRAAIPQDFGRSKSVAWYGILAFGIIWDTANAGEARVIRVTSA